MVTSAEQFKNRSLRELELPSNDGGEPLVVKVKPVSLMGLLSSGKIPNTLMLTAMNLFKGNQGKSVEALAEELVNKQDNEFQDLPELIKLMDVMCENALVEPTFEEIRDYLTDEQKGAIFNYTQQGVKALNSFRK